MKPIRIQRSRQHKMISPNGLPIVYVGRPSKWGNPFKTGLNRLLWYENYIRKDHDIIKRGLQGKNLVCWCPLDQHCHADILLKIANS